MHHLGQLILAAQQPAPDVDDVVIISAIIAMVAVTLLISFAISIVICALLYVAQKRVPAEHRHLEPLTVWLLLIPLFNLVWNFFVFRRIPRSYQSYFKAQGRTDAGDCGEQIGLWYAICAVTAIVPCLNYVTGPAALVLLIIFLVKVMGLRGQIPPTTPGVAA